MSSTKLKQFVLKLLVLIEELFSFISVNFTGFWCA
nr:MAG TPA: hypothetical protein [Caudoviricetes sp.]